MKKKLSTMAVVISVVTILLTPASATAGPQTESGGPLTPVNDLRSISGATPLPFSSEVDPEEPWRHCGTGEKERHWEQDNSLAVNPADPKNLAAAWIQDWSDAIVVAYSHDGGKTWAKSIPPTTPCTLGIQKFGNAPGSVSTIDPSVSFGADGTLYLTSIITSGGARPSAVIVDRSLDGGRTWIAWDDDTNILYETGSVVDGGPALETVDYSYVIADPRRPGVAFATWYTINLATGLSRQYLSVTTDGGESWSDPSIVPSTAVSFGARLLVLADGSLLSIGGEYPPQVGALPGQLLTARSMLLGPTTVVARTLSSPTEAGADWSEAVTIAVADPERFVGPGATLGSDGKTVYATWSTTNATKSGFSMMFATSDDGGTHWKAPAPGTQCDVEPLPFGCVGPSIVGLPATGNNDVPMAPSIAVTPDGGINVAFYDHRRDVSAGDPAMTTDVWLRNSRDGGATWPERHLAGPFDKSTAPQGQLADMNGLMPIPGGIATTLSLAEPLEGASHVLETQYTAMTDGTQFSVKNTDIYFTTLLDLSADLGLTMTASPASARSGKTLTYTISIQNRGPSGSTGVTLSDLLPATSILAVASTTQEVCTQVKAGGGDRKGGTVTCSLGNVASGQTVTVTVGVKVTRKGPVTNTATVNATSPPDPDSGNNTATMTTHAEV